MITLEGINKSFGGKEILRDFSLHVEEGEFVSIVGPSGSGKTTLLNLMGFLTKPDKGKIIVDGYENPNQKQVRELRRYVLGYIFQNYVLMENETVRNNLLVSQKIEKNLIEALQTVGLTERFLEKKVYQLSGGEQQRVAIARTMLKPSKIILADEPTGNLDDGNKDEIVTIFHDLKKQGKTIICVTHDKEVARESDRVITMK